ncbi:ABC transporter permease [Phormidium tenue FACHB-886]|nr:ABC transporter permease [Phormidium tenue FACHB-886]
MNDFFDATLRLAMPLILAATGELVSERAGVLNLSLEGMMLVGAFTGALGSYVSGNPLLGVLCAIAATVIFALLQAFLSVSVQANQLVVGIGLNILALGITTYAYREIFGALSNEMVSGFERLRIPGLHNLPGLGVLFEQNLLVYGGLVLMLITWFILDQTAWGLSIRAVGENPRAADQMGLSVNAIRYYTVLFTGAMAGLAGAFLSLGDIHTFTENMTNGRGYLAIAAVIFGGWIGYRTLLACLLFGGAIALQFQAQALGIGFPISLLVMLPYLLAFLAVTGFVGRHRPPAALAVPFNRS